MSRRRKRQPPRIAARPDMIRVRSSRVHGRGVFARRRIRKGTRIIEYLGETPDVRPYLAAASVFVLPSYYREGTPRTALEALATGRPIVTTDAPGCRETVEEGVNGFLVQPRDVATLVTAMERFLLDPALVERMGTASLELARNKYDVVLVNDAMLARLGL